MKNETNNSRSAPTTRRAGPRYPFGVDAADGGKTGIIPICAKHPCGAVTGKWGLSPFSRCVLDAYRAGPRQLQDPRASLIGVLCVLCLALTGCFIQSIHPFYTDAARVKMPEALGDWILVAATGEDLSTNAIRPWVFSEGDKERYNILVHDKENAPAQIKAVFFKVGEHAFCDFTAGELGDETKLNVYWVWNVRSVHTVYRVDKGENELKLIPLDFQWVSKSVDDKELSLPYIKEEGNHDAIPLFTAMPNQWEEFLKAHGASTNAFPEKHAFVLKRRAAAKDEGAKQ